MNYRRHPISGAFPDLSNEELRDLRSSVKALGILEPVTLFEGMILDGWQRYTTACRLSLPCPTVQFTGSYPDAIRFAMAKQVRRNMTKLERAAVLIALHSGQLAGRGNRSKSASVADFTTLKKLAAYAGIGQRTLTRAKRLEESVIPAVRIVLAKKLITVHEAEQIASKPRDCQRWHLDSLIARKRAKSKPHNARCFLHLNGQWVFTSELEWNCAKQLVNSGVPELYDLVKSPKHIGLVACASIARRPPNEQRKILAEADWVRGLRKIPYGRFERRQLRKGNFSYFECG